MKPEEPAGTDYSCGSAARVLPYLLAVALVLSVAVGVARAMSTGIAGVGTFRVLLSIVGVLLGAWILVRGGEVRTTVRLEADAVVFRRGGRSVGLPYERVEALRYDPPLGASRHWLPALVLLEQGGREWRIPAVIDDGERLIDELVRRSRREDLATWAETLALGPRMGRSGMRLALGYAIGLFGLLVALAGVG